MFVSVISHLMCGLSRFLIPLCSGVFRLPIGENPESQWDQPRATALSTGYRHPGDRQWQAQAVHLLRYRLLFAFAGHHGLTLTWGARRESGDAARRKRKAVLELALDPKSLPIWPARL